MNFQRKVEKGGSAEDRIMTVEELLVMEKKIEILREGWSDLEKKGLVTIEVAPSTVKGFTTITVRDALKGLVIFYEDAGVMHKLDIGDRDPALEIDPSSAN